jgi:hypothetical protein
MILVRKVQSVTKQAVFPETGIVQFYLLIFNDHVAILSKCVKQGPYFEEYKSSTILQMTSERRNICFFHKMSYLRELL